MADQKLTDRSSLVNSVDADQIHIVQGANSFKQSKGAFLNEVTKQGGYSGTTQDLKDELDNGVFSGAITYQELTDLPTSPYPAEGTPAKVANDTSTDNNGYYSVSSGVWVKDAELDGTLPPLYIICSGQSNMTNGDPNQTIVNEDRETDSRLEIWNDITNEWIVADLELYPWGFTNLAGFYNNRLAFHIGKRLVEKYDRRVRLIYEAHGGESITKWMGSGTSSEYFVNIVGQLSDGGVTKVDGIFWIQGESDGNDNDYNVKLQTLIDQFRGLPEIKKEVPFVAGELAQGLDENGDEVLVGVLTNGEKLNRSFYRQFTKLIDDKYFNVAKGAELATVTAGVAAGIHFDGSAVLEYSYRLVGAFENTPRQFHNPNLLIEETPFVLDDTGPIKPDLEKIVYVDASTGDTVVQLPYPKFKKEIWLKRIDTSTNKCIVNIVTGTKLGGVVDDERQLSNGEVLIVKGDGVDDYLVLGGLVGESIKVGNSISEGRSAVVVGSGNSSPNGAGGLMIETEAGGGLDIFASDTTANPTWNIKSFASEDITIIAGFIRMTFNSSGGVNVADWIQSPEYKSADGSSGATGTFLSNDSKAVTVKNGLITSIV